MAYGWMAWKNRALGNGYASRGRRAKEGAYLRGFRQAARELRVSDEGALCPHHILDDPGIDAGGAHDLGRYDAKIAAKKGAA